MLILSRGVSQSIRIGPDIIVMVTQIQAGQVRIGITAPREVIVERSEVWEKKRQQRMENEIKDDRIPPAGEEPPVSPVS